jgi:aerobic-type carbon monoxide dehydrogenase small subunit (CoxS/CutS family)
MRKETISFTLNGKLVHHETDPQNTLLWVLRSELGLMGTKFGCGLGFCGACTILLNDEPVRSCMLSAADAQGNSIITIEGLEVNGKLHPIQKAFMDHDALQCGYCTPGMIMSAYGLLRKNPDPDDEAIINGLEENLCRCGAHKRIVQAVKTAAKTMKAIPTEAHEK